MKKENGTRTAMAITLVSPGMAPTVIPAKTPSDTMPSASRVIACQMASKTCSTVDTP
jgi:hypothetical protein